MASLFGWDPSDPTNFENVDFGQLASAGFGAFDAYQGGDDVVQKPYFIEGQEAGLKDAIATARGQFEQGPNSYYPNSTVAGLDPTLAAGWDSRLGTTDRTQQMANRSGQAAMDVASGGDRVGGFTLEDQIGFGIPEQYQNAIMNPIMRNLNEQIIPGIHTAAQSQGAFGGSRMQQQKSDAATQATKAATDAMIQGNLQARGQSIGQRAGDISAQLTGRSQDIGQEQNIMNNKLKGIGALGTSMLQQQVPGQTMQDVGSQRMQYDQNLLDADVNRFDWNRDESMNYIDRLFARLNGTTNSGSIQEGSGGGLSDAFFGGLSGSNIWNNIFKSPTATTNQGTSPEFPTTSTGVPY